MMALRNCLKSTSLSLVDDQSSFFRVLQACVVRWRAASQQHANDEKLEGVGNSESPIPHSFFCTENGMTVRDDLTISADHFSTNAEMT